MLQGAQNYLLENTFLHFNHKLQNAFLLKKKSSRMNKVKQFRSMPNPDTFNISQPCICSCAHPFIHPASQPFNSLPAKLSINWVSSI